MDIKDLTDRDKDWIEKGVEKEMTRLQMRKKLRESNYKDEKIDLFIDYYDLLIDKKNKMEKELTGKKEDEDEKEFKSEIKKYFENKGDLSWGERRRIKRWLRDVKKYSNIIKEATNWFKKEVEYINKQDWNKGKIEDEMKILKTEIIERLIESKELLDIEHPITGEEVTKENLKDVEIDMLIKLLEDNVETLDLIVNGKITE